MSGGLVMVMVSVSIGLGAVALLALLWGLRTGQFDDQSKFINAVHFDDEEALRDAAMMEQKRKEAQERRKNSGKKMPE
ncbi:cbb3-type cytochrome oxidase assembly protein CcoS [Sulfurospirillum sp. T05]|uniref:Cbb3-type cytochrome oxidase assembly protein CcoS n=1 Tax=Sulfurospirillum tamanense TaxID=2813362 RepID=A0ABS2WSM8_9BACT|nr:cbb3-type cytochrome oxidase assembly protein CcoS [Sulfurospirillum tamanensis]MBN2964669.1 cbb3-type cytochrome oxidase assembly protein CcoS [Sulfurospirillum tamanensis]